MNIKKTIQKAMAAKNLSGRQLAQQCDLSPQTISNYFSGRSVRGLTSENLEKIMEALDLEIKSKT